MYWMYFFFIVLNLVYGIGRKNGAKWPWIFFINRWLSLLVYLEKLWLSFRITFKIESVVWKNILIFSHFLLVLCNCSYVSIYTSIISFIFSLHVCSRSILDIRDILVPNTPFSMSHMYEYQDFIYRKNKPKSNSGNTIAIWSNE